jgi:broad specificity phosphatase PhoE
MLPSFGWLDGAIPTRRRDALQTVDDHPGEVRLTGLGRRIGRGTSRPCGTGSVGTMDLTDPPSGQDFRGARPLRVLLVRHGQSEWNLSGRWQGQADPRLTDLGRSQARSAAAALGDVSAIWSSDLQRAAETAAIIAVELGIGPVVVDGDLREREVGEWAGLTRAEIDERFPGYLAPTADDSPDVWKPRRPPGWESDASVALRLHRALARIRHEVGRGDVLVVSHAGLLYAAERELGADGSRLGNLEGVYLEVDCLESDLGVNGEVNDELGPLSDIARFGGRVRLLPPEELTVPNQL